MTRTHGAFRASSYLLLRCRAWARRPECPHRRHQTRTGSKWASLRRCAPRRRNRRHACRWPAKPPRRCHRIDPPQRTARALVSELGDTCRVKRVVSAANACSDSSRVDGGGKRYTVAMTAVASRMGTLRKEMGTLPSGGWLFLVGFASNSTAEMQIVLLLVA